MTIAIYLNNAMLAALGNAYEEGRLLPIGTSDFDGGDRDRSTIKRPVRHEADTHLHRRHGSDRLFAYITNLHQLDGLDLLVIYQLALGVCAEINWQFPAGGGLT
jgi:hypothetical protein